MSTDNQEQNQNQRLPVNIAGGIHTDSDLANQPPGTTRYALCAVDETEDGDQGRISNELANKLWFKLPAGKEDFIPIGKVYIGNDETAIFLTDPAGNSMIASVKGEDLTVHADDTDQDEKFGFSVNSQIDATFRLRRGCERTLYWVDPKPRTMNLDAPELYKTAGEWDMKKFNLFRTYNSIPEVSSIKVIEGGLLAPGSYNFSLQYLDIDFNPTEFVFSTETISVYPRMLTTPYHEIRGATMKKAEHLYNGLTTKAIKLTLKKDTIDTTYPFYRIAITEANTGNGLVSATKFSAPIPTSLDTFTYTGTNFETEGTEEEVLMFNNIIESAGSIEQAENQLILGNVKGPDVDFCKMQKYASQIKADAVVKQVTIGSLTSADPRNPSMHFDDIGNMPGEIYSYGIVYIFEDNTVTPVFHIPGKSPASALDEKYTVGDDVFPMAKDNECQDALYTERNQCGTESSWGNDYLGNPLLNQKIRHHRFPLRTDYKIPFITEIVKKTLVGVSATIRLQMTTTYDKMVKANGTTPDPLQGKLVIPVSCPSEESYDYSPDCQPFSTPVFKLVVRYNHTVGTTVTTESAEFFFDPSNWTVNPNEIFPEVIKVESSSATILGAIEIIGTEIFEVDGNGNTSINDTPLVAAPTIAGYDFTVTSPETGVTYSVARVNEYREQEESEYKANIFGIKFSNILLPQPEEIGNKKVIGYYIVRNERTETDRTILDSAVMLPTVKYGVFDSQGLIGIEFADETPVKKDVVGLLYPEHKFKQRAYDNFNGIIEQGRFRITQRIKSRTKIEDVVPGVTGYVDGKHKDSERDNDGMAIHIKTRENITKFEADYIEPHEQQDFAPKVKDVFYLDALEDKTIEDSKNEARVVSNTSPDNKIGMLSLNDTTSVFNPVNRLPYVYLKRDSANPYANFRTTPYYKDSKNPVYFNSLTSETEIFNGDSYISPIRYVNSIWYANRFKERVSKTGQIWKYIGAGLLVIAAAVVTVFSLGAATPLLVAAGIAAAGLAVGLATTLVVSGLKQSAWAKAYEENYEKGLKYTVRDAYTFYDIDPVTGQQRGFEKNPSDDEIQWMGDCVNLWFESNVNMGLRVGAIDAMPDFLSAPTLKEPGTTVTEGDWEYFGNHRQTTESISPTTSLDNHMVKKLTYSESKNKGGKGYVGVALAEIYELNPDYERRNKQKIFNHLPIEYDCCSECREVFPHRWHWSQTAFQEELTDNYRVFLPNNYKDLDGETGPIVDIFKIKNNLFLHTEEALWMCPQNFQERTTAEGIVSFLGTGELFNIPPRKIVDDQNSSAGTQHKWGRTKTKHGVLFPSHREKKWYMFNGEQLQPITDQGNRIWFNNNMVFTRGDDFKHNDNPSSIIGAGYISTYDTEKERLIITKKDNYSITMTPEEDYCTDTNTIYNFPNSQQIIAGKEAEGWTFVGYEKCRMKFRRLITRSVSKTVLVTTWIPPVYQTSTGPNSCEYAEISYNLTRNSSAQTETVDITYINCEGTLVKVPVSMPIGFLNITGTLPNPACQRINSQGFSKEAGGSIVTGTVTRTALVNAACTEGTTLTLVTPGHFEEVLTPVTVSEHTLEYDYIDGTVYDPFIIQHGWTMSYSLRRTEWRSWHPYLPDFYLHMQDSFYSWKHGLTGLYKHNIPGSYQNFYQILHPFIVEYVDNVSPIQTKITDSIMFQTEAKKNGVDVRDVTFERIWLYNTEQSSGELNIIPKPNTAIDYMPQQIRNPYHVLFTGGIFADRNERNWTINSFRDIRANFNAPMFLYNNGIQFNEKYYDKIINIFSIDSSKDWTQHESFRDKFLVVRLIFDNFARDTQLTFHLSQHDEKASER